MLRSTIFSLVAVAGLTLGLNSVKAEEYTVDPVHSSVVFKISHMGTGQIYGRFNNPAGKVNIDSDASKSTFNISVKTEDVDTGNAQRDKHLRTPDFFNAAANPTISFKSTSVKQAGEGKLEVAGDLSFNGTTKPVTVTFNQGKVVTDPMKKQRVGFDTTVTIKRSEYGMKVDENMIGDQVTLFIAFEVIK